MTPSASSAAAPLRRPIGEPARIQAMLDHANLVLSAWDGARLMGLLRGWTDFVYDGYICDLAVHPGYHRQADAGPRRGRGCESLSGKDGSQEERTKSLDFLRYSPGAIPSRRLNARLKAASVS